MALRGQAMPPRVVLAELLTVAPGGRDGYAGWVGAHKVIYDVGTGTSRAFDLGRDPREQHPLSAREAASLAAQLFVARDLAFAQPQ